MGVISFICLIIFIILLLYLINYSLKKKKYNEYFEKLPEGTLCGTQNNICTIDQYGTNSCCKGYMCVRPEGNFQYKICRKPDQAYGDASSSHITYPNFNQTKFPKIFPKIHFPEISKPELPSNINIFSKNFWNMNSICKLDNNINNNNTVYNSIDDESYNS